MLQFPSSAQKKFTEVLQTTRGVWFCTNPIYTTTSRKETKTKQEVEDVVEQWPIPQQQQLVAF